MDEASKNTPSTEPAKNRKLGWMIGCGVGCLAAGGLFLLLVAPILVATVLAIGPEGIEDLFANLLNAFQRWVEGDSP